MSSFLRLYAHRTQALSRQLSTSKVAYSAAGHDHNDHGHHQESSTEYDTKEGFTNATWRNTFILTLLAGAAVQYAPRDTDDSIFTRAYAAVKTPKDWWMDRNIEHALLAFQYADNQLLINDAKKNPVHRYRYPQVMTLASPFCEAVGDRVDMSDFKVKTDRD